MYSTIISLLLIFYARIFWNILRIYIWVTITNYRFLWNIFWSWCSRGRIQLFKHYRITCHCHINNNQDSLRKMLFSHSGKIDLRLRYFCIYNIMIIILFFMILYFNFFSDIPNCKVEVSFLGSRIFIIKNDFFATIFSLELLFLHYNLNISCQQLSKGHLVKTS